MLGWLRISQDSSDETTSAVLFDRRGRHGATTSSGAPSREPLRAVFSERHHEWRGGFGVESWCGWSKVSKTGDGCGGRGASAVEGLRVDGRVKGERKNITASVDPGSHPMHDAASKPRKRVNLCAVTAANSARGVAVREGRSNCRQTNQQTENSTRQSTWYRGQPSSVLFTFPQCDLSKRPMRHLFRVCCTCCVWCVCALFAQSIFCLACIF